MGIIKMLKINFKAELKEADQNPSPNKHNPLILSPKYPISGKILDKYPNPNNLFQPKS